MIGLTRLKRNLEGKVFVSRSGKDQVERRKATRHPERTKGLYRTLKLFACSELLTTSDHHHQIRYTQKESTKITTCTLISNFLSIYFKGKSGQYHGVFTK